MNNADESIHPTMKQCGDIAESTGGLTKREYFAAMAMQSMLARFGDTEMDAIKSRSYIMADKMLTDDTTEDVE